MAEEHASFTTDDPAGLGRAAREGMRALVLKELERASVAGDELQECPVCGDRLIHPNLASTWVKDRALGTLICAPCGTERSVLHMVLPDVQEVGESEGG